MDGAKRMKETNSITKINNEFKKEYGHDMIPYFLALVKTSVYFPNSEIYAAAETHCIMVEAAHDAYFISPFDEHYCKNCPPDQRYDGGT